MGMFRVSSAAIVIVSLIMWLAGGVAAQDCNYKVTAAIGSECAIAPSSNVCIACPTNGSACAEKPSCIESGCALSLEGSATMACGACASGATPIPKSAFCFTPKPTPSPTPGPVGHWEVLVVGQDCGDSDIPKEVTCGSAIPVPSRCDQIGKTAVCWDGKTFQNADPLFCNHTLTQPWCTYKTTPAVNCTGGHTKGVLYECK